MPTRLPHWSIVRRGQAEANKVLIERRARQVKEKTKRLNALTGGNHAGQDLIEGEDSSGGDPETGALPCCDVPDNVADTAAPE
jgi:hypothetical protein